MSTVAYAVYTLYPLFGAWWYEKDLERDVEGHVMRRGMAGGWEIGTRDKGAASDRMGHSWDGEVGTVWVRGRAWIELG